MDYWEGGGPKGMSQIIGGGAQSTKGNRGIDMLFLDIQLIDENIYSI